MGAAAAPIAAVAAVGAVAGQAFGDYEKGAGTQAADNAQAAQLRLNAEYEGMKATETNATLTDRLATTLGNIDVIRAAAHTDPTSPTTVALRQRATGVANQERAVRVGNILAQQSEDLASADYLTSAGKFAMNMGELGAATDVLGGIAKTSSGTFGFGGGAPTVGPPLDILNA